MKPKNMILIGQAEVIDKVLPEVRAMLDAPGIYICRDTAKPEYTIPLSAHGGRVFSMVEDKPLDPERFLATAEFHGPYFGDPAEGEHGRLTGEVAALRAEIARVTAKVREIHEVTKRGKGTEDHGLQGNLDCILDHACRRFDPKS